jgi:hypothetical protein
MSKKVFEGLAHDDHDLTKKQWNFIQSHQTILNLKEGTFIKTVIKLPEDLGTVPCALYGPECGDAPMIEQVVYYFYRGARRGPSRQVHRSTRPARNIVVIGIRGGICFTAYGTRALCPSPREPWDARDGEEYMDCREFWDVHALATSPSGPDTKVLKRIEEDARTHRTPMFFVSATVEVLPNFQPKKDAA